MKGVWRGTLPARLMFAAACLHLGDSSCRSGAACCSTKRRWRTGGKASSGRLRRWRRCAAGGFGKGGFRVANPTYSMRGTSKDTSQLTWYPTALADASCGFAARRAALRRLHPLHDCVAAAADPQENEAALAEARKRVEAEKGRAVKMPQLAKLLQSLM